MSELRELLQPLGLLWPRLLLYPGGLTPLALVWLWGLLRREPLRPPRPASLEDILLIAAPLLALAMLPLPRAAPLPRGIDLLVALALLDGPVLAGWQSRGQLVAALNACPALVLAGLLLAEPGGSLVLTELAKPITAVSPAHLAGAAGLLLSLPGMLALGPFAGDRPAPPLQAAALRLRVLGHLGLAGALCQGFFPAPELTGLFMLALAGLLGVLHLALRGRAPGPWARLYAFLALVLLLAVIMR